jgi:histidinol-phosphate aminotransferase
MSLPFSFNSTLQNLPVYQPGRPIEEVARELGLPVEGIIKMASNENPLGPSPAALAAIQRALPQLHLYPDGNAFHLKQKLAKKLEMPEENLVLGNGSNELIEFVGHVFLAPRDEVVVSQHCFAVYPIVTRLFGAELVIVPAKKLGHDLRAMAKAVTPKTKVVFVANPNNPTGTLASRQEVLRLIRELPARVLLVMDEAYLDFVEEPLDLLPLVRQGKHPNLILFRTFSKIYGLAGLRLGYGIGHPEVIAALEKVRQPFNINSLAQAAAFAALDDQAHLKKTRANNLKGLKFLTDGFQRLKLDYVPSATNFVLVRVGEGARVFDELQKQGIIVRPMGIYQLPEWLRITVGKPAENARCLKTLAKVLAA